MPLSLVLLATFAGSPAVASPPAPAAIVGGTVVPECGWPNVVALGNVCTGTLIHPRVVVFAAHCGGGEAVTFGDDVVDGPTREVATVRCGQFPREDGQLGRDFAYCVLAEPQLDVPIVPPLMGCEVEALQPGTEVVVVGFGLDENDQGGIKRQLVTTFDRIENEEAFIGGGGQDACLGDSGGPAFVRIDDPAGGETWRQFGIVSRGDTACIDGSWYGLLHVGMDWFETEADFDLTPCTNADGSWSPDARCDALPADMTDADGTWADGCGDVPRSGAVSTCGSAYMPPVDPVAPTVMIADPAEDIAFASDPASGLLTLLVTVTVDDPSQVGIEEVRLTVDGAEIPGGFDGLAPYEFEARFPAGSFELGAIAIDYAGNVAESNSVLIVIDGELPSGGTTSGGDETGAAVDDDDGDDGCGCRRSTPGGWPTYAFVLLWLVRRNRAAERSCRP